MSPSAMVLPTHYLVQQLIVALSSMSVADYDLNQLIQDACICQEYVPETDQRLNHMAGQYLSWGTVRTGETVVNDGEIIANAWLEFAVNFQPIYRRHVTYDQYGMSHYFFQRLLGYDVVLCKRM
jgi:hypothetical protein